MKKIFLISFLFLIIFSPGLTYAGVVPCGLSEDDPLQAGDQTKQCEFCNIFVLSNNILRWIFSWVVPTVTVLMLIVGGALFLFAGAKADLFNKAKGVITAAVIGLLIIFSAWVIVSAVFDKIGVVELGQGWPWYNPECITPQGSPGGGSTGW